MESGGQSDNFKAMALEMLFGEVQTFLNHIF